MIRLIFALVLACLWAVPCRSADLVAASVRVCAPLEDGKLGSGTGTVIAADGGRCLVLTNRHVCPVPCDSIIVDWANGKRAVGRRVHVAAAADLAAVLIENAPPGVVACAVADRPAEIGEELSQASYPKGNGPVCRRGPFVAHCDGFYCGRPASRAKIDNVGGDSGSALCRDGQIVAVVWGGPRDGSASLCVCHEDVRAFCGQVAQLFPTLAAAARPCTCGPDCVCKGQCKDCNCGNYPKGRWCKEAGTDDLGWWEGDTFKGRWFAKTKSFRAHDGTDYGQAQPFEDPYATCKAAPVVRPVYSPPPFMGGGCPGGNCRR